MVRSNPADQSDKTVTVIIILAGPKPGLFRLYAQIDVKFVKVYRKPNICVRSILCLKVPVGCTHVHTCWFKERKEIFYLTMHSTHFIYGYMVSDILW